MAWLLDKLVPWYLKLAAIAAILMALWGAWLGFKHWITAPAVAKENARVTAIYEPQFKKLTKDFNELTLNIVQSRLAAKTAADTAVAQEKLIALNQTDKYEKEIKLLKAAAVKTAADRATDARITDERVRNATSPLAAGDGSGQQGIRLSGYTDRLSGLYAQCDKDLGDLIETAAGTLHRLAKAEAAVRALSPVK